jgi:hypothetical protein
MKALPAAPVGPHPNLASLAAMTMALKAAAFRPLLLMPEAKTTIASALAQEPKPPQGFQE